MTSKSDSADRAVSRFLDAAQRERGLSPNTLAAYRTDLESLSKWLDERNVPIMRATRTDLQDFIAWRMHSGEQPRSTARRLSCFRRFFGYFVREGAIREDPSQIPMPKISRPQPRSLTQEEVEALLSAPVVSKPLGKRDRTMLEVLYATGVSVSELVKLRLAQVDIERGLVCVRGKGDRERHIPLGEDTLRALREYVGGMRNEIRGGRQTDYLFPTRRCDCMARQAFWRIIKRYARKAGILTELSPNTLRYAFASHLLKDGANARGVQVFLGHSDSTATKIYRHLLRERLKEQHK